MPYSAVMRKMCACCACMFGSRNDGTVLGSAKSVHVAVCSGQLPLKYMSVGKGFKLVIAVTASKCM